MSVKTEWVRYGKNREHLGFAAWIQAAKAPIPGVIVIQEAWGLDEHIEDVTIRFAQAGYFAFAPDLFAQQGERPAVFTRLRMEKLKNFVNHLPPQAWGDPKAREEALSKLPDPLRQEVSESFNALFQSALAQLGSYVPKLVDAAHYLRAEQPLSKDAKVGVVGFCMGGALSGQLACADPQLAASVIFYGNAPASDQISKIACPVLGLYGSLDTRVNAGISEFAASMEKQGKKFEYHIYEGAQHAFFNDNRPGYDAKASRDAFARTLEFFRREL